MPSVSISEERPVARGELSRGVLQPAFCIEGQELERYRTCKLVYTYLTLFVFVRVLLKLVEVDCVVALPA